MTDLVRPPLDVVMNRDAVDGSNPESSWQDLYESAPCGYLSTALDGEIVKVNETFLRWTGLTRIDLAGRAFLTLLSVGSRLFFETRCLPRLRLTGETREVALELRCLDGRLMPILANLQLFEQTACRVALIRIAIFDSSQRQDYERELLTARRRAERSEVRVRVLQRAATAFSAVDTEQALTEGLAAQARAAFDATTAEVLLLTADGQLPAGSKVPAAGRAVAAAGQPVTDALRRQRVVVISSVEEAERSYPDMVQPLLAARLEAMTFTPMHHGNTSFGVLVCGFGRSRQFDDDEMQLKQALVQQATEALMRIRLQDQLRYEAVHDRLTGLANRDLLHRRLFQLLTHGEPVERALTLLFIDLDGFKPINDELGHLVGDDVLVQIADRLRNTVRRQDLVARFGGDEFVVLCAGAGIEEGRAVAGRIRAAVAEPLHGVAHLRLTASIGGAVHQPDGRGTPSAEVMMREADAAMYRSKAAGKDRAIFVLADALAVQ